MIFHIYIGVPKNCCFVAVLLWHGDVPSCNFVISKAFTQSLDLHSWCFSLNALLWCICPHNSHHKGKNKISIHR